MAEIVVTTLLDTDDGDANGISLREAILSANHESEPVTITFAEYLSGKTIELTRGQLTINASVTINGDFNGNHRPDITIDASKVTGASRVIDITAGTVALTGLTITGGHASQDTGIQGAGIWVARNANLTFADGVITDNSTTSGGGGIRADGDLTILNSTISDNSATGGAGGIWSFGNVTVKGSTISGNTTSNYGGGLSLEGMRKSVLIENSTIAENSAGAQGGEGAAFWLAFGNAHVVNSTITDNIRGASTIYFGNSTLSSDRDWSLTVASSIVAGNNTTYDINHINGKLSSDGYNVFGTFNPSSNVATNDVLIPSPETDTVIGNMDPGLGALADNGGTTETVAIISRDSPAINAGFNPEGEGHLISDQRGQTRDVGQTDAGAFEVQTQAPVGANDAVTASASGTLRANVFVDTGSGIDSDPDGDALKITEVDSKSIGSPVELTSGALVTMNADGTFVYDPNHRFDGLEVGQSQNDTFTYTVSDGVLTGTATVTVTVTGSELPSLVVTTLEDVVNPADGLTSLREALAYANSNADFSAITFGSNLAAGGTIELELGQLVVSSDLSINGHLDDDGIADITIDAGGTSRVLSATSGTSTLDGLVLTNGRANEGGALGITAGATVTFTNGAITDSVATGNGNAGGGGVYNAGTLSIDHSTISGNKLSSEGSGGGGILNTGTLTLSASTVSDNGIKGNAYSYSGGGLRSSGTTTIENATFSGNYIHSYGGAMYLVGGKHTITNTTITDNTSIGYGSAIFATNSDILLANSTVVGNLRGMQAISLDIESSQSTPGHMTIVSSIVAGNQGTADITQYTMAATSLGNNVIGRFYDVSQGQNANHLRFTGSDQVGVSNQDLGLGELADNGGPTKTMAIIDADSLALNHGSPYDDLAIDQRGEDRDFGGQADVGAYEAQSVPPTAVDDAFTVGETDTLQGNVLDTNGAAADSGPEGATLTVTAVNGVDANVGTPVTLASGAIVTIGAGGALNFDSHHAYDGKLNVGETASETVTYTVSDGKMFDTATVTITVTGQDGPSLVVDTTEDSFNLTDGKTSLREAAYWAAYKEGGAITFDPTVFTGPTTLAITEGYIDFLGALGETNGLANRVTLDGDFDGDGIGDLTLDGGGVSGLIAAINGTFEFSNLAFTRGYGATGPFGEGEVEGAYGGIVVGEADVTLDRVSVTDGVGKAGGGLTAVEAVLTIRDSTFSGNKVVEGGEMGVGGAILSFYSDTTIEGSTFSGNSGYQGGSAVFIQGSPTGSTITNSTFTQNSAGSHDEGSEATELALLEGAAVVVDASVSNSTIARNLGGGLVLIGSKSPTVFSSNIVAGNDATDLLIATDLTGDHNILGTVETLSFETVNDFTVTFDDTNVLDVTDPGLGALADNGGPTQTLAPLAGSIAIDKGAANGLLTDQRGADRTSGLLTDAGAVEYTAPVNSGGSGGGDLPGGSEDVVDGVGTPGDDLFDNPAFPGEIDGGDGDDTIAFDGDFSDFVLQPADGGFTIARAAEPDSMIRFANIEHLRFGDLTLDHVSGEAITDLYALYQTVFDRDPDIAGLSVWNDALDEGLSIEDIAGYFTQSDEFLGLYGADPSNQTLIDQLYANLFGRDVEETGQAFWLNALENGLSVPELVVAFSGATELRSLIETDVDDGLFVIA